MHKGKIVYYDHDRFFTGELLILNDQNRKFTLNLANFVFILVRSVYKNVLKPFFTTGLNRLALAIV